MDIKTIDTRTLRKCIRTLEHAKANRPNLLTSEQIALDNMKKELNRRQTKENKAKD